MVCQPRALHDKRGRIQDGCRGRPVAKRPRPLLVASDGSVLQGRGFHRQATQGRHTAPLVYSFTLSDLLNAVPTANCALPPLEVLRAVFTNPDLLRPEASQVRVTEHVAEEFAKLADSLEQRGVNPEKAAHFLMRLLFCLFADSTDLLPDHLFRQMIAKPENFGRKLRQLFAAMASEGSTFGPHDIHYFNGGLFADDEVFELTLADLAILKSAAAMDLVTNRTSNLRHTF